MEHKIVIVAKYVSPTNTRGARIKLSLPAWDNKSIMLSRNYEWDSYNQIISFLEESGIVLDSSVELGRCDTGFITTFDYIDNLLKTFNIE